MRIWQKFKDLWDPSVKPIRFLISQFLGLLWTGLSIYFYQWNPNYHDSGITRVTGIGFFLFVGLLVTFGLGVAWPFMSFDPKQRLFRKRHV